jgi:hypothetical protein
MRAYNARRLTDFRSDHLELLLRHAANIHLNMNRFVNTELSDDSPRQNIQVLEPLDNASDDTRISVGDDSEPE